MTTVVDPVCGQQVESSQAAAKMQNDQQTYYFCSESCRNLFDASPARYVERPSPVACAVCGGAISQDDLVCPHCGISLVSG